MNYIYDVVLNFNKDYYNFFEWYKSDNIINIKKIPFFLVDNNTYTSMKYNIITVDQDFIRSIKDKTSTYTKLKVGPSCLITNGKEAMGLLFNDKGNLIKRSSLLLDEEEEVLDEVNDNNKYNIGIIKNQKRRIFNINRLEKEKKDFLIRYISKENSLINLKYLYYDYFEKEEQDIDIIKKTLIKEIKYNWNKKFQDFYNTVKMFNKISN